MKHDIEYLLATADGFKGKVLDEFLANGYYRMQHALFTCNETQVDYNSYSIPVFWLRTVLGKINPANMGNGIRKKCVGFSVEYKTAAITTEINELYRQYRNHISFNTSELCEEYLHQKEVLNPFNSMMVEVRHNHNLIAVGYFDKGDTALAGILNVYHPLYSKYSLGKYLILKKIDYAIANNFTYYYTGYLSTGIDKFDYKLFPDIQAIQVYLPIDKIWMPYSFLGKELLAEYYMNNLV
jgi:leucyl-tRNA---protein transferase